MGLLGRLGLQRIVNEPSDEGRRDLSEMNGGLIERANGAMDKGLAYQDYAAWQNLDENGSFFGPEFAIRATAPRIKAMYVNEPWVYTTATLIARVLSGIPLKCYRPGTDQEIPGHPLSRMIGGGSIYQSGRHQLWSGYLDLVLGGNFFLISDQFYMSLTLAPVELVSINLGDVDSPGIDSITVANPSKLGTRYVVPYARVIHLRLPNPNNPFYGLSPFAAASRPMLLDRYKNEFEMAFYLRGATNNGVIETTQDISKARFERLMRSFEATYTGKRNWWRTLFLPKGATWKANSPTMKDMEHLDGLKENRKTLLSVLGIPPTMVGLTEDVNYATSEAQMRIFYESTIIPMIGFIEDGFNHSYLLKNVYRGQVEVRADLASINALRDKGELAVKGDIAAKVARFLTINEIRTDILQYPPRPDGDVYSIPPGSSGGGKGAGGQGDISQLDEGDGASSAQPAQARELQALAFEKAVFKTLDDAVKWATEHKYKVDSPTEQSSTWQLIQRIEGDFLPDSFIPVSVAPGVTAIYGKLRGLDGPQSPGEPTQGVDEPPAGLPTKMALIKEQANLDLLSVEKSLGHAYLGVYNRYLSNLFTLVQRAVASKQDVRQYLSSFQAEVRQAYMLEAMEVLKRAQQRGYAMGQANTKGCLAGGAVAKAASDDNYRFTEADHQAIDVLAARGKKAREADLESAVADRFDGFSETRTDQILVVIDDGYKAGQTIDQIAADIRTTYDERYQDQAFTIARTEVLSALSAGVKAHVDDLQELFHDVEKEWITIGDNRVRDDHDAFEAKGSMPADYEYAPGLKVPRDYGAQPGQVINCRCSLVNSIPSSATSRASAILEADSP